MNSETQKSVAPQLAPRNMRPEFAQELFQKINRAVPEPNRNLLVRHWRAMASVALVGMMAAFLALSPSARAAAEGFLNLFRVQHIAALPIDPARIQQLHESNLNKTDIESLIGDVTDADVETLKQQAKPQPVSSLAEAAHISGLSLRAPAAFSDASEVSVEVQPEQAIHIRGNLARMQAVIAVLGVTDVTLPPQLEGAQITIRKPAAVLMTYGQGRDAAKFLQARSPEVDLPEGVSLAQLGEIGLRLAGLSPDEAHRMAQTTDWNSTLFVPIPTDAASFREVTLNDGSTALLITTGGTGASSAHNDEGVRQKSTLLWSKDTMVFALSGGFVGDVVEMANSIQ